MEKIFRLYIVGVKSGVRVLIAYLKKFIALPLNDVDLGYLSYYNFLLNYDFSHVREWRDCFELCTKGGETLFMRKYPSSDQDVLKQIWVDQEYADVVRLIRDHSQKGRINVIDAGANVGYTSVYLHSKLKDSFKLSIVAIEPSKENMKKLKMNFSANGISSTGLEYAGLYHKSCYLEVSREFRDGKDWSIQVREVNYPTGLRAVQVSDIIDKYAWDVVDFFKIDIEGAERFLFEDRLYANGFLKKVKIITIEIHEEYQTVESVISILEANRFRVFKSGEVYVGLNLDYLTV